MKELSPQTLKGNRTSLSIQNTQPIDFSSPLKGNGAMTLKHKYFSERGIANMSFGKAKGSMVQLED